uniref:WxcM-like domain-containing protein n=1 Tax=Prevotella sp. TaxID=59823 RepID=UPI003FEE225D
LNHPWEGLFVDVNIWRTLDDFSSGSLCLVLASHKFEEEDYIREYDEYLRFVSSKNSQNLLKTEN